MANVPYVTTDALHVSAGVANGTLGFYGAAGTLIPTVTGARDETEGAIKNLLIALAAQGLIVDGTTAS